MVLHWREAEVTEEIARALRELAEEYPLVEGPGSPSLRFEASRSPGAVEVTRTGAEITVAYGGVADALRGVGTALAGVADGAEVIESRPFTTLGIMLDCSRGAVMDVPYLRRWLRRLALLGYDMVMLYTEDTYTLAGEPFFGAMRGAYTPADLKLVDAYAAALGIEMMGCIQTLGHLTQILKWGAYQGVRDTSSVMLVDEPRAYELIAKMVANYAECFRSRRIHIGMDEAHDMGRGKFMDVHGYQRAFDIFNRHLAQVIGICRERGLRPWIWSDMYFRMGSQTMDYYDPHSVIPADVKAAIPKEVDLVYWDYYHSDEAVYLDFIGRHRDLGSEPVMASGVWSWVQAWYNRGITERNVAPCVSACKRAGVKELFFCLWGDDGAYCEFDSALAGLAFAAAQVYGEGEASLRARYQAVCGIGYDETLLGAKLQDFDAAPILWDDPLIGLHWLAMRAGDAGYWDRALAHYRALADELTAQGSVTEPIDLSHAGVLARLLAAKIDFRNRLATAYAQDDRAALKRLVDDVAGMVNLVEEATATFRRQWFRRNRAAGFEVIAIRMGGLRQRYLEVAAVLGELLDGRRDEISELREGLALPQAALANGGIGTTYGAVATSFGQ